MTNRMTNAEIEALCEALKLTSEFEGKFVCLPPAMFAKALTAIRQLQQPWQGIESAPRDAIILLAWPDGGVTTGKFDSQRYHKTPRPYFDGHWLGAGWMRENQPTHWMPLPHAPEPGQ